MAKDSKTILLFTEQRDAIAYLTDEEAGQMFKAIYDYAEDGVVPKFAGPQRQRQKTLCIQTAGKQRTHAIGFERMRRFPSASRRMHS